MGIGIKSKKTSRYFRNKKKAYLKAKIEEYEAKIKINLLGIYIEALVPLKRVTSLELIK